MGEVISRDIRLFGGGKLFPIRQREDPNKGVSFGHWVEVHLHYLDIMYSEIKKAKVCENVDKGDFFRFLFENSSKYLTPYL